MSMPLFHSGAKRPAHRYDCRPSCADIWSGKNVWNPNGPELYSWHKPHTSELCSCCRPCRPEPCSCNKPCVPDPCACVPVKLVNPCDPCETATVLLSVDECGNLQVCIRRDCP